MTDQITETDYSQYMPFDEGNDGVRQHSSALSTVFSDVNALQRNIISQAGAFKTVPEDTLPENFVSLGWGTTDDFPDPTIAPSYMLQKEQIYGLQLTTPQHSILVMTHPIQAQHGSTFTPSLMV